MQTIDGIQLVSTDPDRLRDWYECAFRVNLDIHGFLRFNGLSVQTVSRDEITNRNPEPGRVILKIQVEDAQATVRHLDAMGVTWLTPLEYHDRDGTWFATMIDPDGNYVRIIELTGLY